MQSRVIPLEVLKERDIMFWLPPGGQDNEVWADTWVIIAELESDDVAPVLDLLRDCDIGGYAARARGLKTTGVGRQLYVDMQQHNKAIDVLMLFLRQKDHPPMPRAERIAPKIRNRITVPVVPRAVALVLKVVVGAALIALFLLLVYTQGPRLWPGVHPGKHPAPTAPSVTGNTH
jgi:hypothetical protein